MAWQTATKPTLRAPRAVTIGGGRLTFEQIRESADLRGWYYGYLITKSQSSLHALFVFAVDAYRKQSDSYRADAILDIFLPVGLPARTMGMLGGMQAIDGVMQLGALRTEVTNLVWKGPERSPEPRFAIVAPGSASKTRQGAVPFRAGVFDQYQGQAILQASAGVAGFNQVAWKILQRGTSGFSYRLGCHKRIKDVFKAAGRSIGCDWDDVARLKAAGFDIPALLGKEGETAPI